MRTGKFAVLYLLSGFGGILFSVLCSDSVSAGASTSISGLVGAYFSFFILNWAYLKENTELRFKLIWFLVLSIVLLFVPGMAYDNLGHLGGLLSGIVLGLWLVPDVKLTQETKRRNMVVKTVGICLSIGLALLFIILIFTVRDPEKPTSSLKEVSNKASEI